MIVHFEEINRVFLIESIIGNGVRMMPMSAIFKDYDGNTKPYQGRVAWAANHLVNDENEQIIKGKSLDYLTRQYDNKEYFRVFWRMVIGRMRIYPDRKFTCSELIYECFRAAGIKLDYESGDFISPGVIFRNDSVELKDILL